ncbi:ATPase [Alteribacter lacisalsi]|uniref:ATPase n=1 Tax=Alteribacter lacisalsi TaxID=2045244 RepID=A0A2W0H5Z6_9BACI|nr:SRPBCC domain-containing protein [Alteribacter lacisalsi]PYZ96537.1 ATPase [Alteribacter lacisalsi]
METSSVITLTMKRQFDASPERVFDAWLDPDMMRKWLFTIEGTNKVAANDPRPGGTWEIIDHRNGKDYRAIGEYLRIDRPDMIVFTFKMPQFSESEDTITVAFTGDTKRCEMSFTQEIIVPHGRTWTEEEIEKALSDHYDQTEHGWTLMFTGLKELAETGKITFQR